MFSPFQTYTPITRFLRTHFKCLASTKIQRIVGKQEFTGILYFFLV